MNKDFSISCPVPILKYPHVLLAHGGGGSLMNSLIETMFLSAFDNVYLRQRHDAVDLGAIPGRVVFTTDSYVIRPLFYPGGNIGSLAVHGTVNDLAMAGARPLYLSVGFILEEGLPMETLWQIVSSMGQAAAQAGVKIVTGDTKVVDKGKGDGIFINTSGIGVVEHALNIAPASIRENDAVIVSGDLGRHGMAIMALREGLEFESTIESDSAPLSDLVGALIKEKIEIHCLRDLTRGGLASALNEISAVSHREIQIEESLIPIREDVASACEMLGLDPLYVANEGRLVCFVPAPQAQRTVQIMQSFSVAKSATVIGKVSKEKQALVVLKSRMGASRILDMLSGEQLPRIC